MRAVVKVSLFVLLTEVAYITLAKLYSKFRIRRKDSLAEVLAQTLNGEPLNSSVFHKVLFFPDPGIICSRTLVGRVCRDAKCKAVHENTSLGSLVKIISLARKSVDVCVYLITSNVLGDVLVDCNERGVLVRVITDDRNTGEKGEVNGAQTGKLRAAGISVYCYDAASWMHHKFMVADNEILVTGSFNWTNQAAMGNLENLIVTSEPQLVMPFVTEFENLYKKLEEKATQK